MYAAAAHSLTDTDSTHICMSGVGDAARYDVCGCGMYAGCGCFGA